MSFAYFFPINHMISNFIPDSLCCLYIMTDSQNNLFSSRLCWIQRPMKSIEIFPLPTLSFWSCHNFILQRIAPSHNFFPSFRHRTFTSLYASFFIFLSENLVHLFFLFTEHCTESPPDIIAQGRGVKEVNKKNFILSKRQTSHLLGREKRHPLILCCSWEIQNILLSWILFLCLYPKPDVYI